MSKQDKDKIKYGKSKTKNSKKQTKFNKKTQNAFKGNPFATMPKSDGTLGRNKDFLIFFDKEKMGIYNMQYETHRNAKKRILEKSGHQYPLHSDDSGNGRFVFGLSFDVVLCNRITFRIQKLDDISHLGRRRHALFRFGACPNPRLQKILRFLQQKNGMGVPRQA